VPSGFAVATGQRDFFRWLRGIFRATVRVEPHAFDILLSNQFAAPGIEFG